jgi:hypothetical protein
MHTRYLVLLNTATAFALTWLLPGPAGSFSAHSFPRAIAYHRCVPVDTMLYEKTVEHTHPGRLLAHLSYASWRLDWYAGMLVVGQLPQGPTDTLYLSYESTTYRREDESDPDTVQTHNSVTYTTLSVVRDIISFSCSYYGDGGAHPTYGTSYQTVKLGNKVDFSTGVNITDVFEERDMLRALMADTLIKRYRPQDINPQDIDEFVESLQGGCDVNFSQILSSWSVYDCTADSATVEFGLPHGCEVNRGMFTSFQVVLAIPAEEMETFQQARKAGTLAKNMQDGHL